MNDAEIRQNFINAIKYIYDVCEQSANCKECPVLDACGLILEGTFPGDWKVDKCDD